MYHTVMICKLIKTGFTDDDSNIAPFVVCGGICVNLNIIYCGKILNGGLIRDRDKCVTR